MSIKRSIPKNTLSIGVVGDSGPIGIVGNQGQLGTIGIRKTKYHILGEDIEVDTYNTDIYLALVISSINILGKPYYLELKKNNVVPPQEIEDFLKIKFREQKIDDILK